jgi:uncharacterized protein YjiS (DUF1127 family)
MNTSNNISITAGGQRSAGDVGTWMPAFVGRLHRLGAYLAERRARRLELEDLYRFSDRELWDVGLSRSDILSIERGTFRRD